MKFFLDTNIIVDVLTKREGYEESLKIIKHSELNHIRSAVSAATVTNVMYILRKHISPESVRETVQTLLLIVDIADVLKSDILSAFKSEMKDFEDAVQASCAKRVKADYIITRNIRDFVKSPIRAILPCQALEILK